MDHILGNKAVFKRNTDAAGDVALAAAVVLAQSGQPQAPRRGPPKTKEELEKEREREREREQAAVALGVAGILSKLASAATTPSADTRTWDNLPQYLSFAALSLPPGEHEAVLNFFDAQGVKLETRSQSFAIEVPVAAPSVDDGIPRDQVVFRSEVPN